MELTNDSLYRTETYARLRSVIAFSNFNPKRGSGSVSARISEKFGSRCFSSKSVTCKQMFVKS